MVGRPFQRQRPTEILNSKTKTTILTGDQKHTDHIATGQRVNRHLSRIYVFYFFSHRTFLKTILASRTSGTFGFAPTTRSRPFGKTKRATFCHRTKDDFGYIKTIFTDTKTNFKLIE